MISSSLLHTVYFCTKLDRVPIDCMYSVRRSLQEFTIMILIPVVVCTRFRSEAKAEWQNINSEKCLVLLVPQVRTNKYMVYFCNKSDGTKSDGASLDGTPI